MKPFLDGTQNKFVEQLYLKKKYMQLGVEGKSIIKEKKKVRRKEEVNCLFSRLIRRAIPVRWPVWLWKIKIPEFYRILSCPHNPK